MDQETVVVQIRTQPKKRSFLFCRPASLSISELYGELKAAQEHNYPEDGQLFCQRLMWVFQGNKVALAGTSTLGGMAQLESGKVLEFQAIMSTVAPQSRGLETPANRSRERVESAQQTITQDRSEAVESMSKRMKARHGSSRSTDTRRKQKGATPPEQALAVKAKAMKTTQRQASLRPQASVSRSGGGTERDEIQSAKEAKMRELLSDAKARKSLNEANITERRGRERIRSTAQPDLRQGVDPKIKLTQPENPGEEEQSQDTEKLQSRSGGSLACDEDQEQDEGREEEEEEARKRHRGSALDKARLRAVSPSRTASLPLQVNKSRGTEDGQIPHGDARQKLSEAQPNLSKARETTANLHPTANVIARLMSDSQNRRLAGEKQQQQSGRAQQQGSALGSVPSSKRKFQPNVSTASKRSKLTEEGSHKGPQAAGGSQPGGPQPDLEEVSKIPDSQPLPETPSGLLPPASQDHVELVSGQPSVIPERVQEQDRAQTQEGVSQQSPALQHQLDLAGLTQDGRKEEKEAAKEPAKMEMDRQNGSATDSEDSDSEESDSEEDESESEDAAADPGKRASDGAAKIQEVVLQKSNKNSVDKQAAPPMVEEDDSESEESEDDESDSDGEEQPSGAAAGTENQEAIAASKKLEEASKLQKDAAAVGTQNPQNEQSGSEEERSSSGEEESSSEGESDNETGTQAEILAAKTELKKAEGKSGDAAVAVKQKKDKQNDVAEASESEESGESSSEEDSDSEEEDDPKGTPSVVAGKKAVKAETAEQSSSSEEEEESDSGEDASDSEAESEGNRAKSPTKLATRAAKKVADEPEGDAAKDVEKNATVGKKGDGGKSNGKGKGDEQKQAKQSEKKPGTGESDSDEDSGDSESEESGSEESESEEEIEATNKKAGAQQPEQDDRNDVGQQNALQSSQNTFHPDFLRTLLSQSTQEKNKRKGRASTKSVMLQPTVGRAADVIPASQQEETPDNPSPADGKKKPAAKGAARPAPKKATKAAKAIIKGNLPGAVGALPETQQSQADFALPLATGTGIAKLDVALDKLKDRAKARGLSEVVAPILTKEYPPKGGKDGTADLKKDTRTAIREQLLFEGRTARTLYAEEPPMWWPLPVFSSRALDGGRVNCMQVLDAMRKHYLE